MKRKAQLSVAESEKQTTTLTTPKESEEAIMKTEERNPAELQEQKDVFTEEEINEIQREHEHLLIFSD